MRPPEKKQEIGRQRDQGKGEAAVFAVPEPRGYDQFDGGVRRGNQDRDREGARTSGEYAFKMRGYFK